MHCPVWDKGIQWRIRAIRGNIHRTGEEMRQVVFKIGALCSFAFFAGACGDDAIKIIRSPPSVTIVEPVPDTSFYAGENILFRAIAAGDTVDADLTLFSHQWSADSSLVCESAPVNADGSANCAISFESVGTHVVQVTVTDEDRETAVADTRVNIVTNNPPIIDILLPESGDGVSPGDLVVFEANVSDTEDSADKLIVTATSSQDGDLGFTATPSSSGEYTVATSALSTGEHLLTFKVQDTGGQTGQDTLVLGINGRPVAPVVSISPDPADSGLSLKAEIDTEAMDPEGDSVTYRYDWYRDGAAYSSGSNAYVTGGITVRSEFWEVVVTPSDAYGEGDPGQASVNIGNSLPRIVSVGLTPDPADTTHSLTCVPAGFFDQDGDLPNYYYEWRRNGVTDTAETGNLYPSAKTARGDLMQCLASPYDSFGVGDAVLSSTLAIDNSPPTVPTVLIEPGTPEPEDDLYCKIIVDSTDADPGDVVTYTYQWYRTGVLSSVTSNTVPDTETSDGDTWQCTVIPDDGTDSGPAGTDVVAINDSTSPSAPVLDDPHGYRNEEEVTITGICEPSCSLLFYCTDSSTSWTETDSCTATGTLSTAISLTRGNVTECYATCTDGAGNTSPDSNTVQTEVCDPQDSYEDAAGYGNSGADPIDEWATLKDDGATTIKIEGNVVGDDEEDWYLISTLDDVAADVTAGKNTYDFSVEFSIGAGNYLMIVHKGGFTVSEQECATTSGYTEYNDKVEDKEISHTGLTTLNECANGSAEGYNNCEDMSQDYYIQVTRNTGVSESCQEYELTITNGK